MNNINLAEGIAEETEKINSSFSQVMKLAIDLKNKCDGIQRLADRRRKSMERLNSEIFELKKERKELRRQRDEALGKQPLFEKNKAEAEALSSEDLKPALVLALCQRDVAMRSVIKIHAISKLLNVWNHQENSGDGSVEADADLISEVNRIIKKGL